MGATNNIFQAFDVNNDNGLDEKEIDTLLDSKKETILAREKLVQNLKEAGKEVKGGTQDIEKISHLYKILKQLERAESNYSGLKSMFNRQAKEKLGVLNNLLLSIQDEKVIFENIVNENTVMKEGKKVKISQKAERIYKDKDGTERTEKYDIYIGKDNKNGGYFIEIDDYGENTFIYFGNEKYPSVSDIEKACKLYKTNENTGGLFEESYKIEGEKLIKLDILKQTERKEKKGKLDSEGKKKPKKIRNELNKRTVEEKDLKLPKEEADAAKEVFSFDVSDLKLKEAIKILNDSETKPTTEEEWEKAGYDFKFFTRNSIQLEQLNKLGTFSKDKPEIIKNINSYYNDGGSIVPYLKDKKNLEVNYSDSKNVFEYLSDRNGSKGTVTERQILTILNTNENNPKVYVAIKELIKVGGGKISDCNSKQELLNELKNNPGAKIAFIKGVDNIVLSKVDLRHYIRDGGNSKKYLEKVRKGSETLNIKLEESFNKKYNDVIKEAKIQMANETNPEKKQAMKEGISLLETSEEKQKLKDFFKFKSLSLFASLLEGKRGGGLGIVIGNNSENAFISKIDLQIGFVATRGGGFVPSIGLAIGDSYDITETIKVSGSAGVHIFGVYGLVGIDKQVNYNDIKEQSFERFSGSSKRLGVYGDVLTGFAGGFSYGGGIYYKESQDEAIKEKEKHLSDTIDKFKDIKNLNDIDSVDLKDDKITEKDQKIIKEDIKNLLMGLGLDKETDPEKKGQLLQMMKTGKINYFRQIAAGIAEKKGWNWSGIAFGIQFIAGFFPAPVIGISTEKIKQKQVIDKQKEIQDNLAIIGSNEKTQDFQKVCDNIKNTLNVNANFNTEKGLFVIEGFNPDEGTIKNINGHNVEIKYGADIAKNIKIEGTQIFIGNVDKIISLSKMTGEELLYTLTLGNGELEMDESSAQKFNKNTPEGLIIENGKEKSEKTQVVESNFNTGFTSFIEKNIGRFNIGISVYGSRQSKLFVEFRDFVDRGELEDAKISLIKFLNLQKRNLRGVKVGEKNKKPGDFIKEIDSLQSGDPKLAFVLQEFIDILFTDISTYKNIDKQHKTGKGEISNYKLAQERKRAFEGLADKILPGSSSDIKELRKIRVKEDVNKTGWNRGTQNNKDIFAAVASYKIAVDKENKIHSLGKKFLTMPPGMVSIADDKITSMDNCNKEELYEELFGAQTYKEQVKKAIISSIQKIDSNFVEDKLTDDNLKKLIINKTIEIDGKTISLPESKFIFFMYGRCYNESVGIKFGNLKIDVPGKASKTAGINLAGGEFVESTTTETDVQNFNVGLIVGDKEHHKHGKREGGGGTTTPIDPENPPPNPNPPSPPPTSDNSF